MLARIGEREWRPFDGYPDGVENLDDDFGFVATVHRVRGTGEHVYQATADATPSAVVTVADEVSFVRAGGPAAVLFVRTGDATAVIRPR